MHTILIITVVLLATPVFASDCSRLDELRATIVQYERAVQSMEGSFQDPSGDCGPFASVCDASKQHRWTEAFRADLEQKKKKLERLRKQCRR